ncbi:MAG: protein kinase [Ramlibacter sp.]|jgi:serine/threonine-protein kinase PpkA|nr:protein kinase [Ramlibacter sp.]
MTTVLVVEDDDDIRANITRLLKLEGYTIVSAANGHEALQRMRQVQCDVVISDVNMPGMGGLELLDAIRADKARATTPVMLLTALDDRASMRRGMASGADDYLAKPFTRDELLEALRALERRKLRFEDAVQGELKLREELLRRAFLESLGGQTSGRDDRFALDMPADAVTDQVLQATVLFSDIRNFTSLAEKLSSAEVAELLTTYFDRSCEPVLKSGGRHLKFIGDGMMAVFTDTAHGSPLPAARRAVSAALAMALAANEFRRWLDQRFVGRALPPFAIGVGVHSGEVTLCRLGTLQNKETTPIGDTVNVAARLEAASKELGWTVVASRGVLQQAGSGVQTGASTSVVVRGKNGMVEVAEVTGLQTGMEDKVHGMATLTERAGEIRAAVQANSEITARVFKEALETRLAALSHHDFGTEGEPLRLKGYRVVGKIGEGGMTAVYLAVREIDGMQIVLKVLDATGEGASQHLSRFIQEYTLLSQVDHPNVIRIFDQGFTDDHAYIAMEYFPRGDLRCLFGASLTPPRVLDVIMQVARALHAVHARGVVHRDLKPENVMVRADDSVALADFGVAKSVHVADQMGMTQTRHGEVVGTPYYLSPEQAAGKASTLQSDFYSLGVMLYEMLTGKRPYRGDTLQELLACHIHAPTPRLAAPMASLQPVLDTLMAKDPAQRPQDAKAVLRLLEAHVVRR